MTLRLFITHTGYFNHLTELICIKNGIWLLAESSIGSSAPWDNNFLRKYSFIFVIFTIWGISKRLKNCWTFCWWTPFTAISSWVRYLLIIKSVYDFSGKQIKVFVGFGRVSDTICVAVTYMVYTCEKHCFYGSDCSCNYMQTRVRNVEKHRTYILDILDFNSFYNASIVDKKPQSMNPRFWSEWQGAKPADSTSQTLKSWFFAWFYGLFGAF